MTIGYITSEYPHEKVNTAAGIGTSTKNLAVELAKKGVKVFVFIYNQNLNDAFVDNGVNIHLIKRKTFKYFGWYLHRKHINRRINNIIQSEKIDLIEAPDWTGITAFMKFRVPLVIRFHGSDAYFCKLDNRKQKIKNFVFEKIALKNAKAFITPTTFAGEETSKIFNLKKSKIKTIHYGLELNNFSNQEPQVYKEKTILYIGTIIRKKGVLELAKIFNKIVERVPKAKLILIGNDSADLKTGEESTYNLVENTFTDQAKKQAVYLGKIPYSEVIEQIKNSQVCTFPSFAETLGMVTIESMALKKPVVNTSIGWAKELIDDGINGYLVHPSDIDLYADRIIDLLNKPNLCSKIGESARDKVELDFDIQKQADKNIKYYEAII